MEPDNKEWVNKGMIIGAAIGIAAGLVIAIIWSGKNKEEKSSKLVILTSIGLIVGSAIGYGGKKGLME